MGSIFCLPLTKHVQRRSRLPGPLTREGIAHPSYSDSRGVGFGRISSDRTRVATIEGSKFRQKNLRHDHDFGRLRTSCTQSNSLGKRFYLEWQEFGHSICKVIYNGPQVGSHKVVRVDDGVGDLVYLSTKNISLPKGEVLN